MTLHRLHLTTRKAGKNNRGMLEHLLRIEEEITKEKITLPLHAEKEKQKITMQQYKKENQITSSFTFEAIQEYLLTTKKENEDNIGEYTSVLVEQIEGDSPLVIDLQGKTFDYLLHGIRTPRHITIQNVEGNDIGSFAGSNYGTANIHFKNINGDYTGCDVGSDHGNAIATYENINGNDTGCGIGAHDGKGTATFENINGNWTGSGAGKNGNSTIVAYNITGKNNFSRKNGILVLVNPNEIPRIEGIYDSETRRQIQTLIAQNATPQEILEYIEAKK